MPSVSLGSPGWDAKVRARVSREHGSLRAYAYRHDIDVDDVPRGRGSDMKVWSRIVAHMGSTRAVEDTLG